MPAIRADKDLFTAIRALGLTIRKNDGEYRVAPRVADVGAEKVEAMAYYTNDREDALLTGIDMARRVGAKTMQDAANEVEARYVRAPAVDVPAEAGQDTGATRAPTDTAKESNPMPTESKPVPMHAGTETGSLINHLYSGMTGQPSPEIGMGCTLLGWTDRRAATVITVDGKGMVTVQRDKAERVDNAGMSESQEWKYDRDSTGPTYHFKWNAKKGRFVEVVRAESGRWVQSGGLGLLVGKREEYYDFSF